MGEPVGASLWQGTRADTPQKQPDRALLPRKLTAVNIWNVDSYRETFLFEWGLGIWMG